MSNYCDEWDGAFLAARAFEKMTQAAKDLNTAKRLGLPGTVLRALHLDLKMATAEYLDLRGGK